MADIEADISGSKPEPAGTVQALDPSSQAQLPAMEAPLNADGQMPCEAGNPPLVDSNVAAAAAAAPAATAAAAAAAADEIAADDDAHPQPPPEARPTPAERRRLREDEQRDVDDVGQAPAAAPTAAAAAADEPRLTPEPGPWPPEEGRKLREDEQRDVDEAANIAWSFNYDQGVAARLEFKGPNVGARTTGRLMAAVTAQLMRRGEAAAKEGKIQGLKTALRTAVEQHFPAAKKVKPTLEGDEADARLMREALTQIDLLLAELVKIEDQNTGGADAARTTTAGAADSTAPGSTVVRGK